MGKPVCGTCKFHTEDHYINRIYCNHDEQAKHLSPGGAKFTAAVKFWSVPCKYYEEKAGL